MSHQKAAYLVVFDLASVREGDTVTSSIDRRHLLTVLLLVSGQERGHFLPDRTGTALHDVYIRDKN